MKFLYNSNSITSLNVVFFIIGFSKDLNVLTLNVASNESKTSTKWMDTRWREFGKPWQYMFANWQLILTYKIAGHWINFCYVESNFDMWDRKKLHDLNHYWLGELCRMICWPIECECSHVTWQDGTAPYPFPSPLSFFLQYIEMQKW